MTKVLTAPKATDSPFAKIALAEGLSAEAEGKKQRILFVCTGNTCRSPMCAAAVNGLPEYKNRFFAFSAGLAPLPGLPISENALFALQAAGILPEPANDYPAHLAREVRESDLAACDLAVGLTSAHAFRLAMAFPAYAGKICTLGKDISDPFGGSPEEYRRCLAEILQGLHTLLSEGENLPGGNGT